MKTLKNKKRIEEIARSLYDSNLPYHNFDHALETIANSEVIIENCKKEKIPVNEKVVYYSLLFHDAGYQDDHLEKGFETKELYSARLAEEALKQIGEDADTIASVSRAIIATKKDGMLNTIEEKIVRFSDLIGLVADYEIFKSNNEKLRREREIITGNKISSAEWKTETEKIVKFYINRDFKTVEAYWNNNQKQNFRAKVEENLSRFLAETY